MQKIIPSPNFTLIIPGGCNAKCDFCFWEQERPVRNYVQKMSFVLDSLPRNFQSLSLSGGEPTLSRFFPKILDAIDRRRWTKVVLTTNGTKLDEIDPDKLKRAVDHINVSRHHYDDAKNREIFKTDTVPDKKTLTKLCAKMNKLGIDMNLNCVLVDQFTTKNDIRKYIKFAKDVGATSVCFRQEQNNEKDAEGTAIDICAEEKWFMDVEAVYDNGCPVCRSKRQYIDGMLVSWKSAYNEPSDALKDVIYEGIMHPNGNVTSDWESKNNIALAISGELVVYDHINGKILSQEPVDSGLEDEQYIEELEKQNEELLEQLDAALEKLEELDEERDVLESSRNKLKRKIDALENPRPVYTGGGCGGGGCH
jgi:MoaA/NifB/PqqE/SkfB family radical SAM enzyme